MTKFTQKSFSIAEDSRSEVPEEERRKQWDATFGNSCGPCADKGWAQTPMRNKRCVACGLYFCPEHLAEHVDAELGLRPKRSCNRHPDCNKADDDAKTAGRPHPDHCHDDCCEDCFGQ